MHKPVVLVFCNFYLPGFRGGGPIRTTSNLVDSLGDELGFRIIAMDRDLGDKLAYTSINKTKWNKQGKSEVFYVGRGLNGIFKIYSILKDYPCNAIYLNSFFSFKFSIIPLIIIKLLKKNKLIIIGSRGEFSKGALALKAFKKRIFIELSLITGLHKNIIWHASTDYEATDIKRVMGDHVTIRTAVDLATKNNDVQLLPRSHESLLKIIFISRISPMKNLLGALYLLRNVRQEVSFDVYGPAEDETYWAECRNAATALPVNVTFAYCGSLQPLEVAATLAKYDLFLFPTFGENYGHVIAEALNAGLPILISDTTPWRDLEQKKIGWDIPLDQPDRFAACIEECATKSVDDYHKWRCEIRRWAIANIGNQDAVDENRRLFNNLD